MTEKDLDAVAAIEERTFALPWSRESLRKDLMENPCARYLVAERAGEIIAYAGVWIILDEGHITNIAVDQAERGRGIGKAITAALLQYAANLGARYLTLEVRVSNEAALRLYRSLGFIKVGVRKKYYEDNGEDGYIMVCDRLPEPQADFEEAETVRA
ncbi:MAG: ribosomal protein S18-alanine N-acetyltransferase [Clostridia bacterium]|nr:ribosomal protein S18-alanine N-acetyltransferase [Clostridia bacterium]